MYSYEQIKEKYGYHSSFAIWSRIDKKQKAKFGVGDISHFDNGNNLILKRNIVLVGLNISGKLDKPFSNFHSKKSTSHDYKIRYALQDTIFWGAYMTDIIKDYEEVMSNKVMKYLRLNPDVEKQNIDSFLKELKDVGCVNPIIIAFGNDAHKILKRNLDIHIYKVHHYSSCITKEQLRDEFNGISIYN